jgi:hypothetical protein
MFSNPSALLGSLLFGGGGFVAFMYGKKMALWKQCLLNPQGTALVSGTASALHNWFPIWLAMQPNTDTRTLR